MAGVGDSVESFVIAALVLGVLALLVWSRLSRKKPKDLIKELMSSLSGDENE